MSAWANSLDPGQSEAAQIILKQSDQGLHYLSFYLHIFYAFHIDGKTTLFKF